MSLRSSPGKPSHLFCSSCVECHFLPFNGILIEFSRSLVLLLSNCFKLLGHFQQVEHRCPLCQFQVINCTNPTTGKDYKLCPSCYVNLPKEHQSVAGYLFSLSNIPFNPELRVLVKSETLVLHAQRSVLWPKASQVPINQSVHAPNAEKIAF